MRLIIDVTPYEEHAQVIYVGLLQHSRVLPLVWKVMPGQQKWDQGFWECIDELFKRLAPHLGSADCTIIGDSAFGCFPMVQLCQQYDWHYLFRIAGQHTCQRRSPHGQFGVSIAVSKLVREPGKRFHGSVRLWQDESIETELSIFWALEEEEALIVISDTRAGKGRIAEYRLRWRVEATGHRWKEPRMGLGVQPRPCVGSRQSFAARPLSAPVVACTPGGDVHASWKTGSL
jgi:hypothetical protein